MWDLLSFACFAGALGARHLVGLVPVPVRGWPWRVLLPGLGAIALALLGLVFGLLAWRRKRRSLAPKIALLFNGTVLVLAALLLGAVFLIRYG